MGQLAHDTIKEEAFFAYFTIISLTSKPSLVILTAVAAIYTMVEFL